MSLALDLRVDSLGLLHTGLDAGETQLFLTDLSNWFKLLVPVGLEEISSLRLTHLILGCLGFSKVRLRNRLLVGRQKHAQEVVTQLVLVV